MGIFQKIRDDIDLRGRRAKKRRKMRRDFEFMLSAIGDLPDHVETIIDRYYHPRLKDDAILYSRLYRKETK